MKNDIKNLKEQYMMHYNNTQICRMNIVRHIPSVSGRIQWLSTIERKLDTYLERISLVLGENWKKHNFGKQLNESISNIK